MVEQVAPAPTPDAAPAQSGYQPLAAHLAQSPAEPGVPNTEVAPAVPGTQQAPAATQPTAAAEPWKPALEQFQAAMLQQMQATVQTALQGIMPQLQAQAQPSAPAARPPAPTDPVLDTYQHLPDEMRPHFSSLQSARQNWAQHINSADTDTSAKAKASIERIDRELAQYTVIAKQQRANAEMQRRLDELAKAPQQQQETQQLYERAAANLTPDVVAKGLPALGAAMAAGKIDSKAIVALVPPGLPAEQFGKYLDLVGAGLDAGFRLAAQSQAPAAARVPPPAAMPQAPASAPLNPASLAPGPQSGAAVGQFPDDKFLTLEQQMARMRQTGALA